MEKDQETARAAPKSKVWPSDPGDTPGSDRAKPLPDTAKFPADEPLDPHLEALNARWEAFEALDDYEGKVALFLQTLEEGELMDAEMAFDMLSTIDELSIEHGDHDRFEALADALRARLPEVYAQDASYYLETRIGHALAAGRTSAIPDLAKDLAEAAGRDSETFNKVVDQLAYHGQLATLVDAMAIAWPLLRESRNIAPWGTDAFAERAASYAIFAALEKGEDCSAAALQSRIEVYQDVGPDALAQYIGHVTGLTEKSWTLDDFRFGEAGRGEANLFYLGVEFLGYLRREEGVPYPKAELAREQIQKYLLDRQAGKLEFRENPLGKAPPPGKSRRKPPSSPPSHGLCPGPATLDRYLGQVLNFINPQRYKAAALMESMPAWLRFLESRQLIDAGQRERTLTELRELATGMLKAWEAYRADPALREGLANSILASTR